MDPLVEPSGRNNKIQKGVAVINPPPPSKDFDNHTVACLCRVDDCGGFYYRNPFAELAFQVTAAQGGFINPTCAGCGGGFTNPTLRLHILYLSSDFTAVHVDLDTS